MANSQASSKSNAYQDRAGRRFSQGACGLLAMTALVVGQTGTARAGAPLVADIGLITGFQDTWFGHHKRARVCVAADYDLDGRLDFFFGTPGDESFVIRNTNDGPGGSLRFELVQLLLNGETAWGGASADYDDDGDYDIFVTCGGNDSDTGPCFLFRNRFIETGTLSFEDVTDAAGVGGAVPPGESEPIQAGHANAVWGDYNQDGAVDLFVSVNIATLSVPELLGRNILWRNNGDGTFSDVTDVVGLGDSRRATRHSTLVDIDNDGDLDLYENNFLDVNVLWQNQLAETGTATFVDVTAAFSPPGEDVGQPLGSFVSAAADFNNDGWQDIMVFKRLLLGFEPVYDTGHVVFLNQQGTGFVNVADIAGLNNPYIGDPTSKGTQAAAGVMGCQLGDVNGDGVVDVYLGNGSPAFGEFNQLYLSNTTAFPVGTIPTYDNMSFLIDFPAPETPDIEYPPYPYRTHGTCIVDLTGDGIPELAVTNGGAPRSPDTVREPNRLFRFDWDTPFNYVTVRPVGDRAAVSLDAIGTRFALTVSDGDSEPWTVYNTLFAGSAFSGQNGFDVYFGLGQADTIHSLRITWPDGAVQTVTTGLSVNTSIVIERGAAIGVPGDSDGDGDVDLLDFVIFADCMDGPEEPPAPDPPTTPADCLAAFDSDLDGDVDLPDFKVFQQVFSGPG